MAEQFGGIRAYARHRKVSHTAVRKAIATGRISAALVPVGRGASLIDFVAADRLWDANTDGAQKRTSMEPPPAAAAIVPPAPPPPPAADANGQPVVVPGRDLFGQTLAPKADDKESELDTFAAVRKERERWTGELQRLRYEATAGELISGKRANEIVFKRARSLRDNGLALAVRLAPQLHGLPTVHALEQRLTLELEKLFKECADEISL